MIVYKKQKASCVSYLLQGRPEQVVAMPSSAAGSNPARELPAASCAGVMPAASHPWTYA
jgi:hypothetical protein